MTDFSLMAPGSQEPNPPQSDYAARDRELSARALASALEFSPEEREQNLMRSFNAAREMNPQVTRMAKRNAEAAGIPFETALQDPKFAEQVLRQQEMERRDLWNRNPTVARFMEDVEFAKLASDDVESLVRTDGFLNTYWTGRQIASGWQQQEQGDLWMNILNKGGEPTLSQSLRLEELDGILRRQKEEEGWTGGFFNVLGQVGGTAVYSVPAAFAGAKAGAVFGPKGAVIGGAIAARAAVFGRSLNTERGNKYGELRKMGLSHEDAEKGSLGYGLVSAGLETIGWGFLTAPAKKLIMDRAARLVSEGLTQELMKTAGKRFIKDTAYSFVPELGTELMQTAAGYFTDLWTIQGSSLNARQKLETAEGIQDLSTQLADTLLQTVKSIGPLSTIAPAIRLSQESRLAREASRSSQLLTDIVQTAGESKLAEEAPQEFARVLNEQAKKAGVETIYIDPEAFEDVIAAADQADMEARAKDAGVTVEEMQQRVGETGTGTRAMLQEKMPEVMNRLDQVKDAGEQVEINTAKFVEVFKNTRLLLLLQKHIKFQRNGRTAAQAEQFEQAKAQLKAQADKAVSESAQKREQLMQGANELRDELRDSLKDVAVQKVEGEVATPMAKEETSTVIEWVVNAAIVGASEDNVSVGEWWAANKFTVLKDVSPEQAKASQAEQATPTELQAAGRRAVPTDPRLQEAAKALAAGTITRAQYDAAVAEFKPVRPFTEPVAAAGMDQVTGAVNATAKPKVSAPEAVQDGREVSIRLDIPALAKGVGVVTVHEKSSGFKAGSPIAYTPAARLVNAVMGFVGGKAFKIAQGEGKDTIGIIKGTYKADTVENIQKAAQEAFTDPAWKQVGGDPERHAYFYDRETMQPVVSADEVIQIGNMVLAKNPVYEKAEEFLYSVGRKTAADDAAYLAAVERGDMKAAQEMVDAAAKAAGLTETVWRGDRGGDGINTYSLKERREVGIFTTEDQAIADDYAGRGRKARKFYVGGKTLDLTRLTADTVKWINNWAEDAGWEFVDRESGDTVSAEDAVLSGRLFDWEGTGSGRMWKDIQSTAKDQGYDIVKLVDTHLQQEFVSTVVLNETKIKLAESVVRNDSGDVVPLSQRFQADSLDIRYAAERDEGGVQGSYFPRTRTIALYEAATLTTFLHEASHWWMTTLFARARQEGASKTVKDKLGAALRALGVDSLETWDALSNKEQEAKHEAFAYNFEDYLLQGRAPTEEQRGLFATIARWTRRLYSNLRTTLSETYEREFGQPLPMLSPELRQVFDRMTATEEQIEATEMLRDLMPMFQTKEEALESGMSPEEWEQFEKNTEAARQAALERLSTASIDQMKNLAGAINDTLASKQRSMEKERREIRSEVEKKLKVEKIYRIIRWLQTKVALDENGVEFNPTIPNKIAVSDVVRLVQSGALPDLKEPAAPKESVVKDKATLAEQQQRANEMRARVQQDEQRLEILRKEFKDLPRTPLEGLDQSGLIYKSRKELDEQRVVIQQAEAELAAKQAALVKAEAEYEKNRKKSKKARMAEGLTEEQWEAEQKELDAQLPTEVAKVNQLESMVQKARQQLDRRGTVKVPQFKQAVQELVGQLTAAENDLKKAQEEYASKSRDARDVEASKKEALIAELAAAMERIKALETKVAQKRSNLAKARVDLEDAQKRPTVEGTDRDKLQTHLRNLMSQRKTAEEKLRDARAKIRRQAESAAETALDKATKEAKKAKQSLGKQQDNLEKITKKMTMTRRQEAAVEVRRIHRFVQSERVRLRDLEKRIETLEKKIELNEPTLQGPVIERLGNMLTRQESGVALQAVAALWSIQGGSTELLRMLYQTPALEEAIEAETDRLMMEKHGDYQSREAAEGVVADAMHEQARTKLVATELRWLQQQVQRIAEDLDPDLKKQREGMAAELELANKRVEDLAATIKQVKETAKLNPKLAELEKQRTTAQEQVQEASAAVTAGGPNAGAAAADLQQKQAALTQVLGEIDAIYGPDYTSVVTEWNAAKKQARELELRNRKPQLSVDVMVAAAAAVAEDAIDNTMVKEISSAKHQAEEGRQNRKTLEALGMTRAKDKKGQPRLFKALESKRLQLVHHMKAKAARRAEKEIKKIELAMKRVFKSPLENVNKNYSTELYTAARALAAIFGFGPEVAVARAAEQLQATSKYHPEMWQRIQDILGPSILQSQQVKDYRELTFSQLQDVNQLVKGLLELARAEKVVELNGRRVEVEEAQNKLTESLSKHKKPFTGMGSQKAASNWQKFLKFWDSTKAWLRGMEQWTVSIDGGRGAWWDLVYNPIKTSLSAYSVERNRLVGQYAEWLGELDIDQDPVSGSEIGYEFKSMAEVLGALLHTGNRSNYRKLLLGRGWGSEVNNELDDSRWKAFVKRLHDEGKLKKEHWDFLQNVWNMMEGIKPRLQDSHFKVFGYFFREVQYEPIETPFGSYRGGYVPAKTDPMLVASRQSEEDINQINGDMRSAVPSVHSNWRHERVEAYTQPLNLDLTMVLRHIDETVRFIHVQPVVQNVLRIIRPFEQRNSPLGQVDQAAYSELIIPWMVSAARQVTSTRGSAFGHQVIDRLRRWTGLDALFGNLANALGNLTSLPMAVRKLGWRAVGSGLRQVLASGYTTRTGAERLSTWIPTQSDFMNNRQRGKMLELAQMLDSLVNDPGAYRKVKNLAQKNGYFLQTMTQSFCDLAIWKGAYDKFKTMPESQGLSEEEIHKKAVEFADYMVRDSSPSLSPEDQAQYLKQGPFIRLMVQYSGYFNWLANVNVTDFGNLIRDLGWKTPLSMRFYQQLILGYVAPLFLADALMSIVAGRFYDDDEDEDLASAIGENVLASVGRGTASMLPGVGQVAMALYGLSTEDPNDERVTNAPAIGYIMRAGRGAMAVAREAGELVGVTSIEKEVSGREIRDIFGLLSLLTGGLPTGFLGKPAQFLTDVNAGNYEEPSLPVWTGGLMSGKVQSASR